MKHILIAVGLAVLLAAALLLCAAPGPPNVVMAQDPLQQPPENDFVPAEELPLDPSSSPSAQILQPSLEEIELRQGLDALEAARHQGAEAVLGLLDTLRGRALDQVTDEIIIAHEQLARSAPPLPASLPVSLAEEEAAVQNQLALDAANRIQPLQADPSLDQDEFPTANPHSEVVPNAPATDLTVGSPPCTYATITAAMAAANSGDRLLLEGGVTFLANLSINKSLTFQGGYAGCGSGSTARTTIDGGANNRVMYIYENLTITLENLNITNGNTSGNGAGIFVRWNTQLTGNNLEIYNNTSAALGGGVRLWGGSATFTNTNIHSNTAQAGAGVYGEFYSGYPTSLNLSSYADVFDNLALTGNGYGGGVYISEGTVSVADCSDIVSNDAIQGGGAYLITSTLTMEGSCSEIMFNAATGNGGGIYARASTINLDNHAELYNNQSGSSGGGAYLDDSTLWGDLALIYYNTTGDFGGGVYATNGSLLDMDLGDYPCTGPRCSQLSYNTASTLYGGGVYAAIGSEVDLRQVFVESNSASLGGGIYAYQSPVYLYNSLLAGNNATSASADGLRLYNGANLIGQHNTLAYNDAGGAATGFAIAISGSSLSMSNSIVWGHTTSIDLAGQTVTCSDIQGGYTGTDNMDVDPLFISPASVNFHLQSASPVMDRCATGQTVDFDNETRPVTYIRPASPYDMGADEGSRRVGLNGGACAYGRIQDAVDAAAPADTIQLASDEYLERVNLTDKNLTIAGGYDSDCTTMITGTTTVNGNAGGSVLYIADSLVTLRDLQITGGNSSIGGGVQVMPGSSQVTLDNTDIFNNHANYGGGIYVDIGNVLTFTNDSGIYNNTATYHGGGARVWGKLVGNDWASAIFGNTSADGGGVSLPGGELELSGSHITNNMAIAAAGRGGGIHVYDSGVVHATGSSNISNNGAYDGAGIYAENATVHLVAVIHGNVAANNGGGVYLSSGSTLASINSYIGYPASGWGGNRALNGAGLYIDASTLDFDGYIFHNVADYQGGGIYANASELVLTDAAVGGTAANSANQLGPSGHYGAGMYLGGGSTAILDNTTVAGNTFQTTGYTYGGGAYLAGSSIMTATNGSSIEYNTAPNAADGRGAGVYLSNSTVTIDNSHVVSNTAGTVGGAFRLYGASTLNITNNSVVSHNTATTSSGGAIEASGTPDINISNAALQYNSAATNGGAIHLDAGTLDFAGWWDIRWNDAGIFGGAAAVDLTADADFAVTSDGQPSYLALNHAGANGGAVALLNTDTVALHATSGYRLNLNANTADGIGGALYANAGGFFDIYGNIQATSNIAGSAGGFAYLSGGSRIWLDDYFTTRPQVWVNFAPMGGAIYAVDSPRVELDGVDFGSGPDGNMATAGSGGAVYLDASTFDASNCSFRSSKATVDGGAIAATNSSLSIYAQLTSPPMALRPLETHSLESPFSITATSCDPLTRECSSFYNNTADSDSNLTGYGGAIYLSNSSLQMNQTYLHHNTAARGGALYLTDVGSVVEVSNSLLHHNSSGSFYGSAIRVEENANLTLMHTTLADNTGGPAISQTVNPSTTSVYNSIIYRNDQGFSIEPDNAVCNIDQDGIAGLDRAPLFLAPGASDYHLTGGSPAVDACTTGLAVDLDGHARPLWMAYDMGAYEFPILHIYLPLTRKSP